MRLFLVLALVIAISAIIFALQNPATVIVNLWFWKLEGSLVLVLLLTLGVGFIIGLLVSMPAILQRSLKIAAQKKKMSKLEKNGNEKTEQISSQLKRIEYLEKSLKQEMGTPNSTELE